MRQTTLFFHPIVLGPKVTRMTFAFEPVFNEGKLEGILASHSMCSVADQFCRKTGREIALSKTPTELKVRDIPTYVSAAIKEKSFKHFNIDPSQYYFLCMSFVE